MSALTKKYGPLKVWQYSALAGAILVAWYIHRVRQAQAAAAGQDNSPGMPTAQDPNTIGYNQVEAYPASSPSIQPYFGGFPLGGGGSYFLGATPGLGNNVPPAPVTTGATGASATPAVSIVVNGQVGSRKPPHTPAGGGPKDPHRPPKKTGHGRKSGGKPTKGHRIGVIHYPYSAGPPDRSHPHVRHGPPPHHHRHGSPVGNRVRDSGLHLTERVH